MCDGSTRRRMRSASSWAIVVGLGERHPPRERHPQPVADQHGLRRACGAGFPERARSPYPRMATSGLATYRLGVLRTRSLQVIEAFGPRRRGASASGPPSSSRRSSSIPKWCANSCTSVTRISAKSSSSSAQAAASGRRNNVIRREERRVDAAVGVRDAFVETEQTCRPRVRRALSRVGVSSTSTTTFSECFEQRFGQVIECFGDELFEASTRHVHTRNVRRETCDNDARKFLLDRARRAVVCRSLPGRPCVGLRVRPDEVATAERNGTGARVIGHGRGTPSGVKATRIRQCVSGAPARACSRSQCRWGSAPRSSELHTQRRLLGAFLFRLLLGRPPASRGAPLRYGRACMDASPRRPRRAPSARPSRTAASRSRSSRRPVRARRAC